MTLLSNLQALKDLYVTFRGNPENDEVTDGMWCGQQRQQPTLIAQMRSAFTNIDVDILTLRRSKYAQQLSQVDQALFDKAIAGDAKAADLVYRRFEGWSPKQADDKPAAGSKTFAELIQEAT